MRRVKVFLTLLLISLALLWAGCIQPETGPSLEEVEREFAQTHAPSSETLAEPEEIPVVVEGWGTTKEEAEADARVKALQTVVGMKVFGMSKAVNYTLVEYAVISKTLGYIRRSEILEVRQTPEGLVSVKVRYYVSKNIPEDDVTYILMKMKKPRVGLLVTTFLCGSKVEDKTAEVALIDVLKKYEFDLYDTQRLKELVVAEVGVENLPEVIKRVAKMTDIDVLVVGEAKGDRGGEVAGLLAGRAKVDLKVYWVHTGRLIGAVSGEAGASDISYDIAIKKAIEEAAKDTGKKLIKKIVKEWMDYVANGLPLDVIFKGIDYDQYLELKASLSRKFEVSSSRYSEGEASFTVRILIPAEEFYLRFLKPLVGKSYRVKEQFLTRIVMVKRL